MQHRYNIFYFPIVILLFILASCSKEEKIIPKKTMSRIVGEMYLADQYISQNPTFRAQMDSLYLYEAVTSRHGYTYNDYCNSTKYYLQDGDSYTKIFMNAKEMLRERYDHLNKLIALENNIKIDLWAVDSLKNKEVNNLWKEPFLRSLKWLSMYDNIEQPESWRFTDTCDFDSPQNAVWWINNIRLQSADYIDSLYPLLTKDYTIALEKHSTAKYGKTNAPKGKRKKGKNSQVSKKASVSINEDVKK